MSSGKSTPPPGSGGGPEAGPGGRSLLGRLTAGVKERVRSLGKPTTAPKPEGPEGPTRYEIEGIRADQMLSVLTQPEDYQMLLRRHSDYKDAERLSDEFGNDNTGAAVYSRLAATTLLHSPDPQATFTASLSEAQAAGKTIETSTSQAVLDILERRRLRQEEDAQLSIDNGKSKVTHHEPGHTNMRVVRRSESGSSIRGQEHIAEPFDPNKTLSDREGESLIIGFREGQGTDVESIASGGRFEKIGFRSELNVSTPEYLSRYLDDLRAKGYSQVWEVW